MKNKYRIFLVIGRFAIDGNKCSFYFPPPPSSYFYDRELYSVVEREIDRSIASLAFFSILLNVVLKFLTGFFCSIS
jgi:hypothetical protein